jgi:hypothetical protein
LDITPDTEIQRKAFYAFISEKVVKIEKFFTNASEGQEHVEILKTKLLLHYHLTYYYSILMMQYQSFEDIDTLRNQMLENYKKAVSLSQTLASKVDLSFTEDSHLIEKCNRLYNKHYRFSIKHATETLTENIEKANRWFDVYNLMGAAQVFEECLDLINQVPALVMNNNKINPDEIIWSLARIYRDMGLFEKAYPYFKSILLKKIEINAVERFEIRDFFTKYLAQLSVKKGNTYFELQSTHQLLSQTIQSDVDGLKKILIEGGSLELQREAMKEITLCFIKNEAVFHQFTEEVIQAFLDLQSRNVGLAGEGRKLEIFSCYHQVLFDISTNIHLGKLQLSSNVNPDYIYDNFSKLALKAGNPQACYNFALARHGMLRPSGDNFRDYLFIRNKLAIALADDDWSNNEKNILKKNKAIELKAEVDAALLSARLKNPLSFFPGEKDKWKRTIPSEQHIEISELEALLQERNQNECGQNSESMSYRKNLSGPQKSILKKNRSAGVKSEGSKMVGKRKLTFDDKEHTVKFFVRADINEQPIAAHKDTETFKIRQSYISKRK